MLDQIVLVAILSLDKYIPPETSYMYMRPLQKFPSSPVYARQRVGIVVSIYITSPGFSGYTNHFNSNVKNV